MPAKTLPSCFGAGLALAALSACGGSTQSGPPGPAHAVHISAGAYSMSFGCVECHGNQSAAGFVVEFPANGMARTLGQAPSFDPVAKTCSNVYCHGAGLAGGTPSVPAWSPPSPVTCTSCHGVPPATQAHGGVTAATSCGNCHTGYTATAVNLGFHLNGAVESTSGACGSCHAIPPTSGRHTISEHRRLSCDKCHPAGYTSTTVVAATHDDGKKDIGPQAGWNATARTCANSCHGSERW
jgi:predicted CxxxxCH...CXXCH cytochrome family protein